LFGNCGEGGMNITLINSFAADKLILRGRANGKSEENSRLFADNDAKRKHSLGRLASESALKSDPFGRKTFLDRLLMHSGLQRVTKRQGITMVQHAKF